MDPRKGGVAYWQTKCSRLEREKDVMARENAELKKQLIDKDKKINLLLRKGAVSAGSKRVSATSSSSPPEGGDHDHDSDGGGGGGSTSTSTKVSRKKKIKLEKENVGGKVQILEEPEPDVPEALMKTYAQLETAEKFVQGLIRYLDKKSVLNCRLACRRWNLAIQKYYEVHPLTYPVSVPPPPPMTSTSHQLFRGITLTPSNMQRFHKHLQYWTKLNPGGAGAGAMGGKQAFLSRNLTLSPELGKGSTAAFAFFQKVNQLLETYGIHEDVWYLTIVVKPGEDLGMAPASNVYYRWVQNCLVKMRNLKSVTLVGQLNPEEEVDEKELGIQMRPFKLPGIGNLRYMCFGIENLPRVVEEQFFVKYGAQLWKLRVSLETLLKCREVMMGRGLEELRELVVYFDAENEERHVELLGEILKAPGLQRLKFEIFEMTEEQVVGWGRRFGELVDLKIECVKVTKGEGEGKVVGGGGNVRMLEINDDGVGVGGYDFLREFGKLEYLRVRGSSKEPKGGIGDGGDGKEEGEGMGVDLREWMYGDVEGTKVYQSRVWEILGELKEFVFEDEDPEGMVETRVRVYTREGYNTACERAEEEAIKFKRVMEDVEEREKEEGRKEDWRKVVEEVTKIRKEEGGMEVDEDFVEQADTEVEEPADVEDEWNQMIADAKKNAEKVAWGGGGGAVGGAGGGGVLKTEK